MQGSAPCLPARHPSSLTVLESSRPWPEPPAEPAYVLGRLPPPPLPCHRGANHGSMRQLLPSDPDSPTLQITTSTAQVLLNMLMFKQNVRSAVDEPRVHDQLLPDYVLGERDYASGVRAALEAKGHNWRETDHIAVTQAVRRLKNGHLTAASDKRKGGVAAGF